MKKILLIMLLALIGWSANAQTNVSGGIYSNTTWTLNNSPYIVTDTIVVFPGVTLTIEPGVVVKFYDNQLLEIRQATLIANGTNVDSITFTSNSNMPSPGIWVGLICTSVQLNPNKVYLNYCNILYANRNGGGGSSNDSAIIKNSNINYNSYEGMNVSAYALIDSCNFNFNGTGLDANGTISNCNFFQNTKGLRSGGRITNCNSSHNQIGFDASWDDTLVNCISNNNSVLGIMINSSFTKVQNCIVDSNGTGISLQSYMSGCNIINCEVNYNGTGITDSINTPVYGDTIKMCRIDYNYIGLKIYNPTSIILCNRICNNSFYGVYNHVSYSNSNWNLAGNYWGSNDSSAIESFIYDGYDNINLGLVFFTPVDSIGCYLNGNCYPNFVLYPDTTQLHHYIAINYALGVQPLHYLWSWGDGNTDTTAYPSHTYLDSGMYNICLSITDASGCQSTFCDSSYQIMRTANYMVYINVISPSQVGISVLTNNHSISLYPNPSSGIFTLSQLGIRNYELGIYDVMGREVYHQAIINQPSTIINLSQLSNGIYFYQLSNSKETYRGKIVKD